MFKYKFLVFCSAIYFSNSFINTKTQTIELSEKQLIKLYKKIDSEIHLKIFPGASLAIIKEKKVYTKNFGFTDYSKKRPVNNLTLYDLASLTKVLSTTMAIMYLVENKIINIEDEISKYLTDFKDLNNITIKDLLQHQSGLIDKPYKENSELSDLYKRIENKDFNYTDINFILLGLIVKKVTGTNLDKFVESKIYKPLGLNNTFYNPLKHNFDLENIAPTEIDPERGKIHSAVHDEKAFYLMEGVSGNAGLFSNITDLTKLIKMFLNRKIYSKAGKKIISEKTFDVFFKENLGTHYALGWRKGFHTTGLNCINKSGFSHLGFTGSTLWIDFENQFALILLTNRVHPSRDNLELMQAFRVWLGDWLLSFLCLN